MRNPFLNILLSLQLILPFWICCSLSAAPSEAEIAAFNPAARSFQDRLFERAERELDEFIKKFPASEKRAEAILLQGQARYELGLYDAAIRVLSENLKSSGPLTDQFLYWIGQSNFEKANYADAAAHFARLLRDQPGSRFALAGSYGQALAAFKLNQLDRTISLLKPAESDFQKAANSSTNKVLAARGELLLAEAQIAKQDYPAARETLGHLRLTNLAPELEWPRQQLLTRVDIAQDQRQSALARTTNLFSLALAIKQPSLAAHALTLQAEVLQLLEKPALASETLDRILAIPGLPAAILKQTLQRTVDMLIAQNQLTNAMDRLQKFIAKNPADPSQDALHLNLGELQLKQFRVLAGATNATPGLASLLESARTNFDFTAFTLTNSPLAGRALLGRGWVFWEQAKLLETPAKYVESAAAFESAAKKLPKSEDQATARFKWADCQYQLKDYASAITNYLSLLQTYEDVPQIRNSLFDQLYYQIVRVRLDQNDLANAADAVENLLRQFPSNPLSERALLVYAEALIENGKAAPARESLLNFTRSFPQSTLKPEAELAMARTYLRERNWTNALDRYSIWITNYPRHTLRPQALFDRAWISDLAHFETNAFNYFTNFLALFPTDSLAPKAQNWIANYYFNQENYPLAEQNYQRLYQNTNWPVTELTFEARLMAAKTAWVRQGYNDAKGYLTNLLADPKCPATVRPEAYYMLGDVLLEQNPSSTNALSVFADAFQAFDSIIRQYPSNRIAALAWGRIGDCHFQYASETPESYALATNAYQKVLDWKLTDVPVTARNQADFGLGACYEKLAKLRPPAEQKPLLLTALDHYLNVVYGKNLQKELPDPFWLKKSALAAGRLLSEGLNRKEEAIEIYKRAREPLPSLRTTWDEKIKNLLTSEGGN